MGVTVVSVECWSPGAPLGARLPVSMDAVTPWSPSGLTLAGPQRQSVFPVVSSCGV